MALARGYQTAFSVDDWRGTLTVISGDTVAVRGLNTEVAELETSAFADTDRTRIGGVGDGAFGVDGFLDATIDTGSWHIISNVVGVVGSTRVVFTNIDGGTITYNQEALMSRFSFDCPVDGLVTFSTNFLRSGALTRS